MKFNKRKMTTLSFGRNNFRYQDRLWDVASEKDMEVLVNAELIINWN